MGVAKSMLKIGIDAMPDKVKGKSVANELKKKGVKDEELKFSGLDVDPKKDYTKAELQELEKGRKDKFGKVTDSEKFKFITLEEGKHNPTYRSNVYTYDDSTYKPLGANRFSVSQEDRSILREFLTTDTTRISDELRDKAIDAIDRHGFYDMDAYRAAQHLLDSSDGVGSRYTSDHYPEIPNYLMHTRTYDDTIDGTPTRVVQEIQSDLHQSGRRYGYDNPLSEEQESLLEQANNAISVDDLDEAHELAVRAGMDPNAEVEDWVVDQIARVDHGAAPTSPYEKSWLAKGIEREIMAAAEDGRGQIAIPIKGDVGELKRDPGVQKWYESSVANTAKKIAKQQGLDFEMKSAGDAGHEVSYAILKPKQQRPTAEADDLVMRAKKAIKNIDPEDDASMSEMFDTAQLLGFDNGAEMFEATDGELLKRAHSGVFDTSGLKLYSTPAAAAGAAYLALKEGKDPSAVLAEQGFDEDEIAELTLDAQAIQTAIDDPETNYSFEDVMGFLKAREPQIASREPQEDPGFLDQVKAKYEDIKDQTQQYKAMSSYYDLTSDGEMDAQELLAKLNVIQPNMASISTRISAAAGNDDASARLRILDEAVAKRVTYLAKKQGIDLKWDTPDSPSIVDKLLGGSKYYIQTEQGEEELSPGIWQSLKAEAGETGGAITGGIGGAVGGAKLAAKAGAKHPAALGAAAFTGSLLGAMGGAVGGTELDYLRESIELSEDMSATIAGRKALTAAEASIIGDTIAFPLSKLGGAAWQAAAKAKNLIMDGNTKGAKDALLKQMFLTESEADELVKQLDAVSQADPKTTRTVEDFAGKAIDEATTLTPEEQTIRSIMLTQPGGEVITAAASTIDQQAGRAIAKSVGDRAKDILAATKNLTDENIGRILVDDLTNYTTDVKQFYGKVKEQVAKSPRINNFSFDYDKLALDPVLDTLEKNLVANANPALLDRFRLQSQHIKSMSDSRTLTDLIELRQMTNDFLFNKRITKAKDFDTLRKVISNIDGAIKQGAGAVMEDPKKWLGDFALAKTQYAKMKQLEKNVIARTLGRKGLKEETVVKTLSKYINDIDGNFQEVMSKLPMKSRKLAEGAVIDNFANKYSDGVDDMAKAIDFPSLARELDSVVFTTPSARKMKAAINKLAEVFKNDVPLAYSTGQVQLPKFQSYLTANPVVRAKYEAATQAFNKIKQLSPTKEGKRVALILRTAELLENPLNSKLIKDVMDEVADDTVLTKQLAKIQQEAVKAKAAGKDSVAPRVELYGTGNVLSAKGTGKATEKMPLHRIATYETRKQVAETHGIDINDTKKLDKYLVREGYVATQQGADKVRRLK